MNTVEPIRDINKVLDLADYLKARNQRDYIMYIVGIYSGLRISDILNLRVRDVRDKDYITLRENKTGKEKRFPINDELKHDLKDYIRDKKDYEYLFKNNHVKNKAISRQQAYNILSAAAKNFNIDAVGTHTLRKTFGYHMYQQTHDIATLKELFNHADESTTFRYIGLNQDVKDKAVKSLTYHRTK